LGKDQFHIRTCSREDSNLHGSPHTVLSRTRLPVPPREQRERGEAIEERRVVKRSINPHWHQHVEEGTGDFENARTHFVDQVEVDLVVGQIAQRRH
jgi:hypothetical protein